MIIIKQLINKLFSCEHMLEKNKWRGEIPPSKTAYKTVFMMAWPAIIESLLVSLIGSVDTMMVGTINSASITAVGITTQPKFVLLMIIISLNVGITAIIARRVGANDKESVDKCLKQGIIVSTLLSLTLAVLGIILARPFMNIMGADAEIIEDSIRYFKITMVGMFFSGVGLTVNAAQRGAGNTRLSMTTNISANIVNLIFNYLLINGIAFFPKLGVAGAGIATVLGNITAFALAIFSVIHKNKKRKNIRFEMNVMSKKNWMPEKEILRAVFTISGSAAFEQVFMRIGFVVYSMIVIKLGTANFAIYQICMNILSTSFALGEGTSIAATALVGQSLGSKREDMAVVYAKISQKFAFVFSTVIFFIFLFGRFFLVELFSKDPELVAKGGIILIIIAFTTHIQTGQVVISGILRGVGDSKYIARTSLISVAISRPIFTWLFCFPLGFGVYGAFMGMLLDQIIRFTLNYARFKKGQWQYIKI